MTSTDFDGPSGIPDRIQSCDLSSNRCAVLVPFQEFAKCHQNSNLFRIDNLPRTLEMINLIDTDSAIRSSTDHGDDLLFFWCLREKHQFRGIPSFFDIPTSTTIANLAPNGVDLMSGMAIALDSSRHFPSAVAFGNRRNCGRHTECACYFEGKSSAIWLAPCRSQRNGLRAMINGIMPPCGKAGWWPWHDNFIHKEFAQ